MVLSGVILLVEALGAYFSRSLSLTVDAAHNVPDILAFGVSWAALRGTVTGASRAHTFGTHRLEVFASLFNAALVLLVGVAFAYVSVEALRAGSAFAGAVSPVWIFAAAVPTLGLRTANLVLLRKVPRRTRDLNLRSVLLHLGSDLVITAALLFAGGTLLLLPGAWWADLTAATFIGGVLVWESLPLFRDAWEVLTERTPRDLSVEEIASAALAVPAVAGIHDVHVWAVCPTLVCMSAHVRIDEMSVRDSMSVVARLRKTMEERFGIVHSVFEVEVGASHPGSEGA